MNDPIERLELELEKSVEASRRRTIAKITLECDRLTEELLKICYSEVVDDEGHPLVDYKIKLAAISMLLDRGLPRLAVDNSKTQKVEDNSTSKKFAKEIAALVRGEKKSQDALEMES